MIDRIVLSQDRNTATLVYTDRASKTISSDNGNVLDLVIFLLTPNCNHEVNYSSYINSLGDTAIVNIEELKAS